MIRIMKGKEPDFWNDFKMKNPGVRYEQLNDLETGKQVRKDLREYLLQQQYKICCYCCRRIDLDNSLNEHIRPQALYPDQTMDYGNIVASCTKDHKTCGSKKGNQYDENLFVSPLDRDCEEHFAFFPNGDIAGLTEKGEYTIKVLGLDSYKLKQARAAVYRNCELYDESLLQWYLEVHEGILEPFADVIRYYVKNNM